MAKTKLATLLVMAWVCAAGATGCGDESGVCFYGGERHQVGERFPDSDGCNTCECRTDGVACTTMGCRHDDGGPPDVVGLPEACSSNGLVACTLMACIRSATTPPSDVPSRFEAGARGH